MSYSGYCKVYGCRFPQTHLTKSHKCGKCDHFGHGQVECNNPYQIEAINKMSYGIRFPSHLKCTSPVCPSAYSHSTEGHYCTCCKDRHLESACPHSCVIQNDPDQMTQIISDAKRLFGQRSGKIYTTVYVGQGCEWYVKRNDIYAPIQSLFMHGDSWGQYGPQSDDRGKLNAFCTGYVNVADGKLFSLSNRIF